MPGMDCVAHTGDLVQMLGGEVEEQELTGEAYVDDQQGQQARLWH